MANYISVFGICEAKSPIFHGGNEKTGSSPILRTIMIWTKNGEVPIPYIHGNAIRGKLRRQLVKDMVDRVGFTVQNKKLYHSLFSGGVLESSAKNTGVLDLTFRREIVEFLAPISLLGCAVGNQLIQGKLIVGHMWPICQEYAKYLPEEIQQDPRASQPVRVFTDEAFITRRDDLREEREKDEQATQMKVDYECFIPGTAFYHEFKILLPNSIEKACFSHMLSLWQENPIVGGRSNSGDGELILNYNWEGSPDEYLSFLEEKKEQIVEILKKMEEAL